MSRIKTKQESADIYLNKALYHKPQTIKRKNSKTSISVSNKNQPQNKTSNGCLDSQNEKIESENYIPYLRHNQLKNEEQRQNPMQIYNYKGLLNNSERNVGQAISDIQSNIYNNTKYYNSERIINNNTGMVQELPTSSIDNSDYQNDKPKSN